MLLDGKFSFGLLFIVTSRPGPSLYGARSRIVLGGASVRQYDWLLSKLDYSHTINLTHPLSVLFVVAVLLTSYHSLPACFYPSVMFNSNNRDRVLWQYIPWDMHAHLS